MAEQNENFDMLRQIFEGQGRMYAGLLESVQSLNASIADTKSTKDKALDQRLFAPERYDGRNDPWAVRAYVSGMNKYFSLHKYDDNTKLRIFGARLTHTADIWYSDFMDLNPDYPYKYFVESFIERFIPAHWESEIIAKFNRLKQTKSVKGYISTFERMKAVLPKDVYTSKGLVEHFIGGLKDPAPVRRFQPQDLQTAFRIASADEIDNGSREKNFKKSYGHGNNRQFYHHGSNYSASNNFTANDPDAMDVDSISFSRRNKTVTCWHCGKPGHVQRNCPEKAKNGPGRQ